MVFLLFGFWLILNGRWTGEIAIVGAVVCGLLYAFMVAFMGFSPRKEWRIARLGIHVAKYFAFLIKEVFASAFSTIRLIWSPREVVQPVVTSFRSRLKTDAARVILANSITLTPGTITVDLQDDVVLVHCLDEQMAEGIDESDMEQRLLRIEEADRHA